MWILVLQAVIIFSITFHNSVYL